MKFYRYAPLLRLITTLRAGIMKKKFYCLLFTDNTS